MQITKIEKQAKRDRYNVHADGKFVAALDAGVLAGAGLSEGDILTNVELATLLQRERFAKALAKAYQLLARRSHSVSELTRKLGERGFGTALAVAVCEHLGERGYLDDRAFAKQWVTYRGGTRGNRLLRMELRKRGVADDVITEALAEGERDQLTSAKSLARRRLERFRDAPPEVVTEKLGAFLVRRGYDYATARAAVSELVTTGKS